MKKRNYLLFASVVMASILAFSGCDSKKSPTDDVKKEETKTEEKDTTNNETPDKEQTSNLSASSGSYTLKDEVLFDNDKCKFVVKDINAEGLFGPELNIYLENKTDQPVVFTASDTSVNGYMLDPIFYEELEPNTNKVGTISFSSSNLEKANITILDEIQFLINAHYSDNYDAKEALINDIFSLYPTGKKAGEITYIARTSVDTDETVLDEKDVKFVVLGLKKDDFMGPSLEFYIENNSDKTLNFTEQDVVVNNTSFDTLSSTTVSAGKKIYSLMYLSSTELEKNSITDITNVKFKIKVSDYSDPTNWMLEPLLTKEASYTVK